MTTLKVEETVRLKDVLVELKQHDVIMIEHEGSPIGALVSLEFLEAIEDESWHSEIEEAMADPDEIPWEEVKARARGLTR